MDLNVFHEYGEELEKRLRLQTYPIAVTLLEKESNIPEGVKRPVRDFGYHISLCQALAMSRREGTMLAMLKEDMWCFEPVLGYGLAEPPEYFLEGHNRYPLDVMTLEAGANYAREFPCLEVGKYIGVMSAPLTTTPLEPDVVMLYCNSAQLSLLLLARECKEGFNLKCNMSSHASCVYAIVFAIQSGECQVAVPCRGDRYAGLAGDDEMVFSAPKEKLEDLIAGLRYVHEVGYSRLPRGYEMKPEWTLPGSYKKAGKMLGMDWLY